MLPGKRMFRAAFALALLGWAALSAHATWSIIVVDTATREIAVGSATCLTNFDLLRGLPVVRVDVGAAAAQSAIDGGAVNRQRIWTGLINGDSPETILALLAASDASHQSRQYGIVDWQGRALTFTGANCGAYANGLTGSFGSCVYSIQGNVITGQPVLEQAELALISTPGGLPEKLMAAMEAARAMGGDGRCSCSSGDPDGCGSPPPSFVKSAHIGFMVVARRGDSDGSCSSGGCATGPYYLKFNIANQQASAPDPVIQLRERFDQWRADLVGVPDQVESRVTVTPSRILSTHQTPITMRIELRDWRGEPVNTVQPIGVEHDPRGSANSTLIGDPIPLGQGVYEVQLTPGSQPGIDVFAVSFVRNFQNRYLIPSPTLQIQNAAADLNADGVVDLADLAILLASFGTSGGGDVDGDGDTDIQDLAVLLSNF
ncbi:MAG: DUF1028 domain-containing protein [Planctomycetes bacterium]|nr:DUF1028 domain-containing protein [Planctomycetota bacterium]